MTAVMTRLREALPARVFGAARDIVGLHLAGDRLCAAQVQRTAGGVALSAVGSLELGCPWYAMLGEPRRFRHALRRFWADHGFRGSEVVAAMPQEQLKVFSVEYTAAPGQTDAEAVAHEVKERMKGKAGGLVVDFVPVRQASADERSREAVVATAAREDVTTFLDFLHRAGLQVSALDITGMALKRVVPWVGTGSAPNLQNALLIHFGAASSQLTVVWGRRLMLDRSIEFCEQRLTSRVVRVLGVAEHEARRLLAEHGLATGNAARSEIEGMLREIVGAELALLNAEVSKTLHYAASKARGNGVERVLLVGAVARFPGVAQLLSTGLGLPADVLDPLSAFSHSLTGEQAAALAPLCGVAVAVGLALRGVPGPGA